MCVCVCVCIIPLTFDETIWNMRRSFWVMHWLRCKQQTNSKWRIEWKIDEYATKHIFRLGIQFAHIKATTCVGCWLQISSTEVLRRWWWFRIRFCFDIVFLLPIQIQSSIQLNTFNLSIFPGRNCAVWTTTTHANPMRWKYSNELLIFSANYFESEFLNSSPTEWIAVAIYGEWCGFLTIPSLIPMSCILIEKTTGDNANPFMSFYSTNKTKWISSTSYPITAIGSTLPEISNDPK